MAGKLRAGKLVEGVMGMAVGNRRHEASEVNLRDGGGSPALLWGMMRVG